MKTPKEKAFELFEEYQHIIISANADSWVKEAKKCALITVEIEYNSMRELLFNLRACKVIESETTYLARLDQLIKEENEVKQEIEKL